MEICRIIIPDYIRTVKLSEARMTKYYEKGKKAVKAKKYLDRTKYDYLPFKISGKVRHFLADLSTKQKIPCNPKVAGTPKFYVINGQDIYNQFIGKHTRARVMNAIKEQIAPYIKKTPEIKEFPISIRVEVHDLFRDPLLNNQLWDLDNRFFGFYAKAIQDVLLKEGIIPDDNISFITQSPSPKFIPIDDEKDRKLVCIIEKETDERIINHRCYNQ